jgi:IclR family transcriptional regulator, KDG regulon repressor
MVGVLRKAFDALELLAQEPEKPLLLRDIAETLDMNQPTCARILQSLVEAGYAEKPGERKGFLLGPMAFFLAERGPYRKRLATLAAPIVARLAESLREHAILATLHKGRRYVLCNANGNPELQIRIDSPYFEDLYTTATGRLLLSFEQEAEIRAYVTRRGAPAKLWDGMTTTDAILRTAAAVRERGFVLDESAVNTAKIAFAVRQDNRVVAALGVTVPKPSFVGRHRECCLAELEAAAKEVEHMLQHTR